MIRALWTSSTGMEAQQANIDVIAHNLANVNTTAFKRSRADYQDLLYQEIKTAGASSSPSTIVPTGIHVGQGVRMVSTAKMFSQGNFKQSGNALDLAIEGDGFFQITMPVGGTGDTSTGEFKVDRDGRIVTSDGYVMEPEISLPQDAITITISADGIISVTQPGITTPTEVGNIELARFINPSGLNPVGRNLYLITSASGDAVTGVPGGADGHGNIAQGFLEMSNVSVVEEMVAMIAAQRAYEINSKAIQTADQMLQTVNSMKR